MSFTRVTEDFTCAHCGYEVQGNGYTNHCPRCLWSKHVDVAPGDRGESCGGMMEPVAIEGSSPEYRLLHRCVRCGRERRNAVQSADARDAVAAIAQRSGMRNT